MNRRPVSLALLTLVLTTMVGALGALPVETDAGGRATDPVRLLAWLALWAAPAGCIVAGSIVAGSSIVAARGLLAAAVPIVWAALTLTCAGALPHPVPALCVVGGLYALGVACGSGRPEATWSRAGGLALLAGACAALPTLGGLFGDAPWSPGTGARTLDLSPVSLVVESAGVDWMRHPAVYEPAGADAIGPDVRLAYQGSLAGPTVLLVGCALAWGAGRRARRRTTFAA